jgi:hypothetical protein
MSPNLTGEPWQQSAPPPPANGAGLPPVPEPPPDVAALREQFPRWAISLRWLTAASGPDQCLYLAVREDGAEVTAWSVATLARHMELEDRAE